MLATATSGYLSSSFSGWSTTLWWLVDLPDWDREDEAMNEFFSGVHTVNSWALLALVGVHVAGALYHSVSIRGVVRRMLNW